MVSPTQVGPLKCNPTSSPLLTMVACWGWGRIVSPLRGAQSTQPTSANRVRHKWSLRDKPKWSFCYHHRSDTRRHHWSPPAVPLGPNTRVTITILQCAFLPLKLHWSMYHADTIFSIKLQYPHHTVFEWDTSMC